MAIKIGLIFLITIVLQQNCICDDARTVKVELTQGVLQGKTEKSYFKHSDYYTFLGVPYAEPPLGKLRFQPPAAHGGWSDTYEAYDNKPTCLQFSSRMRNHEPFGISGSEDCLYLSVFTPSFKGSAPVIVFDYNDSFRTGFNGTQTYSPEFFVEEDVIVVTISHRLGLFGYITTGDDVMPGNLGLRDYILGLQWIKENIQHFGGDPERVTLMGNSAGAALVEILLYSEKAKGLFHAAIMQSGSIMEPGYFYFEETKSKAFLLGEEFDIKTDDSKALLEGLQKIDAQVLLEKEVSVLKDTHEIKRQRNGMPFTPIVEHNDDGVLTFLPENGRIVNDVPVLIGFNSREGLDLASRFIIRPEWLPKTIDENVVHFPIRTSYRFDPESKVYKEATKEILNFYFKDKSIHFANLQEYAVYAADVVQNYALVHAVKKLKAELESPIYQYLFDFRGELNENSNNIMNAARYNIGLYGATIVDELCYLHLCNRIRKNYEDQSKLVSEQAEFKVLKSMVRMWTNFAKAGNPTPSESKDGLLKVTWKPVDRNSDNTAYLHITKKSSMKLNPLGERAQFWDQFLDKYSKLAVDGVVTSVEEPRDEL